jgi:phage-related protein (TIGR01555 family)
MGSISSLYTSALHPQNGKSKRYRRDSIWINPTAGFAPGRDKAGSWEISPFCPLSPAQLEALFHGTWEAQRIVSALPNHSLRKGFGIKVGEDSEEQARAGELVELMSKIDSGKGKRGAISALMFADIWGRLFGGSIIVVGADDRLMRTEDPRALAEPLDEGSIEAIRWLRVVDRQFVSFDQLGALDDPEHYLVMVPFQHGNALLHASLQIHSSRVIRFDGAPTTDQQRRRNGGWDNSVLDAVVSTLRAWAGGWASVEEMLYGASVGVFKFQGVAEGMAADNEIGRFGIRGRLAESEQRLSTVKGILLDAEGEDYDYKNRSFASIPELLDRAGGRLAAAANMPETILFGRSPAGMNATGEGDLQAWHSEIESHRENALDPRVERLTRLFMLAKDSPFGGTEPERWSIEWPPLKVQSEGEIATTRKSVAETDAIYIDRQVLTSEEVAVNRFGAEGYSMETTISVDEREKTIEGDLAAMGEPEPEERAPENQAVVEAMSRATEAETNADAEPLNGAQVQALVGVLERVFSGTLSIPAAGEVIAAAFPQISTEAIDRMLSTSPPIPPVTESTPSDPVAAEAAPVTEGGGNGEGGQGGPEVAEDGP